MYPTSAPTWRKDNLLDSTNAMELADQLRAFKPSMPVCVKDKEGVTHDIAAIEKSLDDEGEPIIRLIINWD